MYTASKISYLNIKQFQKNTVQLFCQLAGIAYQLSLANIEPEIICGFVHSGYAWQFAERVINDRGDAVFYFSETVCCVENGCKNVKEENLVLVARLLNYSFFITNTILTLISQIINSNNRKLINFNEKFNDNFEKSDQSDNNDHEKNDKFYNSKNTTDTNNINNNNNNNNNNNSSSNKNNNSKSGNNTNNKNKKNNMRNYNNNKNYNYNNNRNNSNTNNNCRNCNSKKNINNNNNSCDDNNKINVDTYTTELNHSVKNKENLCNNQFYTKVLTEKNLSSLSLKFQNSTKENMMYNRVKTFID